MFIALKKSLKKGWPNRELKKLIIPYLFELELNTRRIKNRSEVIKFLIAKGAEVGDILVSSLDFEAIKAFGENGVNLNYSNFGYTPLHAAVTSSENPERKEQIEYLLKKGVDPNKNTEKLQVGTALHLTMANESFEIDAQHNTVTKHDIAKYLLNLLPQYKYNWNIQDGEGKTPLILAAKMRATDLITQLIAKKNTGEAEINLNAQDNNGRTALHFCCALGDAEGVRALLEAGASVEVVDKQGQLPFDYTSLGVASVRGTLEEIHIDPDRDEYAINNHIVGIDGTPTRVKKHGAECDLLARKEDWDLFGEKLLTRLKNSHYKEEKWREYDQKFFKLQGNLSGKPLFQACLDGQKQARNDLLTHLTKESLTYTKLLERTKQVLQRNPDKQCVQDVLTAIQNQDFAKALRYASAEGENYLVALIVAHLKTAGLSVKEHIDKPSMNGKTSLHWSAGVVKKTGDKWLLELFLTYQPDTTVRDNAQKLYSDYLPVESVATNVAKNIVN